MAAKAEGCLALILLLSLLVPGRSNQPGDPVGCAEDMTSLIEKTSTAAMDITFATEDCTPPGMDELDCSADIIDTVQQMANLAGLISSSTFTCGGINNACAVEVANTIADTTDFSEYLISAAADCAMAPFNCVVDVFEAINAIMSVAVDIDAAVTDCNPTPMDEYAMPNVDAQYSYDAAVASLGEGPAQDVAPVERRLSERVAAAERDPLGKMRGERKGWQHHVARAHETLALARERRGIKSAKWTIGQTHTWDNAMGGTKNLTAASVAVVLV